MNSIPIFWHKPALQFPRPDRMNLKSRFAGSKPGTEDVQSISALVSAYGLSLLSPAKRLDTDGRSQNWLLVTKGGNKILKKYKSAVEPEHILHEHSILSQLALMQFPAPRLNKDLHGESLTEFGNSRFALFDYLDGYFQFHEQIFFPSQASTFLNFAAISLASLHDALRDFIPVGKNPNGFISREGSRWRDLSWFQEQLVASKQQTSQQLKVNPEHELNILHRRGRWIENRLTELEEILTAAPLDRVIIHGDYGPYNLLFKNGSPVVVIDFELARLDWRLTDLAYSMITFTRNRLGFQQKKMRQFIQAYQSASKLEAEQLDYLPLVWEYLSLRRLTVCWRRALDTGQKSWLVEALDRLQMIDWIAVHKDDMLKMITR